MRKKQIVALVLALLMLCSLTPATGFAEGDGEENEGTIVRIEPEETADEEAETIPEPADPEADPVAYDLWVCGVQATSANQSNIDGSYLVRFDPANSTLTIYSNKFFIKHASSESPAELPNGALIDSGLPELTVKLMLNADDQSNYISSDLAETLINVRDGSLTIETKEGTSPYLRSNSAEVGIRVSGGDLTVNGSLNVIPDSAKEGIHVSGGALTLDGKLNVRLSESGETAIYAEKGIRATGTLDADAYENEEGIGIRTEGPITVDGNVYASGQRAGIYCGSGNVVITGIADIFMDSLYVYGLCPSSGIYAVDGSVELGTVSFSGGAVYAVYANGINVTGDADIENTGALSGGSGFRSTRGGVTIDGNAIFDMGNGFAIDSGDAPEGILIRGSADLKNTANANLLMAKGGPIYIDGDLTAIGRGAQLIYAKDVIGIIGNAKVDVSFYSPTHTEFAEYGICSEEGGVYVGGDLEVRGQAGCSVFGSLGITANGSVTVVNTKEDYSVGLHSGGTIAFSEGVWDVSAGKAAILAGEGIAIPVGFGVTVPVGGRVAQLADGTYTVTADGEAPAAHAVIKELPRSGDLNRDRAVDTEDLLLMRKYLVGLAAESDLDMDAADMTLDGVVDIRDLVRLRIFLAEA